MPIFVLVLGVLARVTFEIVHKLHLVQLLVQAIAHFCQIPLQSVLRGPLPPDLLLCGFELSSAQLFSLLSKHGRLIGNMGHLLD